MPEFLNLRFSISVFYDSNLRCTTSVNTCQFWPRQLYDGWPPWNNSLKYTNRITFSGRKKWMMRFMVDFFLVLFNAFLCQNRRPKFFTRCIDFPYHFLKLHLIFTKRKISEGLNCICWSLLSAFNYCKSRITFPANLLFKIVKMCLNFY